MYVCIVVRKHTFLHMYVCISWFPCLPSPFPSCLSRNHLVHILIKLFSRQGIHGESSAFHWLFFLRLIGFVFVSFVLISGLGTDNVHPSWLCNSAISLHLAHKCLSLCKISIWLPWGSPATSLPLHCEVGKDLPPSWAWDGQLWITTLPGALFGPSPSIESFPFSHPCSSCLYH